MRWMGGLCDLWWRGREMDSDKDMGGGEGTVGWEVEEKTGLPWPGGVWGEGTRQDLDC